MTPPPNKKKGALFIYKQSRGNLIMYNDNLKKRIDRMN